MVVPPVKATVLVDNQVAGDSQYLYQSLLGYLGRQIVDVGKRGHRTDVRPGDTLCAPQHGCQRSGALLVGSQVPYRERDGSRLHDSFLGRSRRYIWRAGTNVWGGNEFSPGWSRGAQSADEAAHT